MPSNAYVVTSNITQTHVDLNLLAALDALLDERSVSGAAARLHLSQPAMSRTLARIRDTTGDPILIRAGRTMVPSPRAMAVRNEVSALVRRARSLLLPDRELEPATLERTFTIRCHDALLPSLGTDLVCRLRQEAPNVTLRFLAESASDAVDLRAGSVDLDIGSAKPSSLQLCSEQVAEDVLAVVLRPDHPCARGKLTAEKYADALHVVVSRRGRLRDPLDDALQSMGLTRRVVASAPTSSAALHLVRGCNLIAVVASRPCSGLARSMGLVIRPLPISATPIQIVQSWHAHLDGDVAHQWLRRMTRALIEAIAAKAAKRPRRAPSRRAAR